MTGGQAQAERVPTRPAAGEGGPRLGFIGLGWIGLMRMRSLRGAGLARVACIADADPGVLRAAAEESPEAEACGSMEALLEAGPEGVVIATPNACHAGQALAAIERGIPVFCQKPLATRYADARRLVDAARRADVLLGVDMSYRHLQGVQLLRELLAEGGSGRLGRLYALELTFHNAYGPGKAWFFDRRLAGGGCLLDLGVHLLDLAAWLTGAGLERTCSTVLRKGVVPADGEVEDFAWVELRAGDVPVRVACSWNLHAGRDCRISFEAIGDAGVVAIENVGGSFLEFQTELRQGTHGAVLCREDGAWGPKALAAWAGQVGDGAGFDESIEAHVDALRLIDSVYERVTPCAC